MSDFSSGFNELLGGQDFASAEATIFWPAPKYGKNAPTQKRRWLDTHFR